MLLRALVGPVSRYGEAMTFSVVGRSDGPEGPSWGVAVASKFLAVGGAVPAAVAEVGAVATQAEANVAWKSAALVLLDQGLSAQEALDALVAEDERPEHRQAGVVDAQGNAATHTGTECFDWAGGITGEGVAIQGNILAGPQVVEAMKTAWDAGADLTLAHRLLETLRAGDDAGGDQRGRQSAALYVVRTGAGYGGLDDVAVDLRVDDHPEPVTELTRLLELNDLYLTASTDAEKVVVDAELDAEITAAVQALGHRDLAAWVGTENYEMRVAQDGAWIDRQVLAILRNQTG